MKFSSSFIFCIFAALVSSKAVKDSTATEEKDYLPTFSLNSGFYKKDKIKLKIENADPKAVIYYTLDGSIPTLNSTIYKKPIVFRNRSLEDNVLSAINSTAPTYIYPVVGKVRKGNVIRAMAQLSDGSLTDVVSKTYFVGLDKKKIYKDLPIISMITDPDNLFDYEKGIYVLGKKYDDDPENLTRLPYNVEGNYSLKGKDSERPATIEYIPGNDNIATLSQDVGIRIKGKASRTFDQKSFRIISREKYGKKNIKFDLIPGNMRSDGKGPVTKYKSFVMRDGGNDCKFARIRDNLNQYLIGNRGIETQQNDQAIMFIDGEYWGIYSIYEDYDEHYIENNYGIDSENVIIIKKDKIESGVDSDISYFNETISFLNDMDMSVQKNIEEASKKFDVEGFAWLSAFHLYVNVQDSILKGSNWSMWRVREPDTSVSPVADGKWRVLLFDTEYSLGIFAGGTNYDQNLLDDVFNPEASLYSKFGSKILKSLLKNKEFKNLFINALSDVRNIDFETKRVNSVIDKMAKRLYPVINEFFERFPISPDMKNPEDYYRNEVELVRNWLNIRNGNFLNLVSRNFDFQPPVNVTISSNDFKKGSFIVNGGWKVFEKRYTGEYFRENILYITAKPSASRKLNYWNLKNCKFADEKYANLSNKNKSTSETIGIYPDENCRVSAHFK